MQLREIEIDRFGIWQDVTLPFNERGITVLYGPNEAGKSTLLRFIRGVLYGFLPHDERTFGPDAHPVECSGTLRLQHMGKEYRLRRTSQPGTRGRLEINGRIVREDDPLLKTIVSDTREAMFQNIFAIGLPELQQLATLSGDEIAQHIYGLSLGPEGDQLFRAQAGFAEDERRMINPAAKEGELFSHANRLAQIDKELARHAPATEKHNKLQLQLRKSEDEIAAVQARHADAEHELRGRLFLSRVWGPWKKERELRKQFNKLPKGDVDREILNRFDQTELELSEVDEKRQSLIAEAKQLQTDAEAIPSRPELEEHACAIQNLFEKSRTMQALDQTLTGIKTGYDQTQHNVNEMLGKLEGRWDLRRLEQTDLGPAVYQRLWTQAGNYRQAIRARARHIQRYKRGTAALRALRAEWKTHTKDLGKLTIADARKVLQKRLHEMEELRGLKVRRDHLRKALELLNRDFGPKIVERELPPFFWMIHSFFMFAGCVLLVAGLYAALHGYTGIVAGRATAWIVGACFALLGFASMGTVWAMKEYFQTVEFATPDTDAERESLEHELHRVEQAIDRILRRDAAQQLPPSPPVQPGPVSAATAQPVPPPAPLSDEEIIRRIRQQLTELDQHEPIGRKIDDLRLRLSSLRQSLQEQQRNLGRARRDWTETLRRIGLAETLKVSQAFEQCQVITDAKQLLREQDSRNEKEIYQRQELDAYYRQIRELSTKLEAHDFRLNDPYTALAEWDRELKLQGERRRERTRLRQTAKEKRQEAAQLVERIEHMRRDRTTLLKRLGVDGRDEIILKLAAIDERNTLEHQLKTLTQEIQQLAEAEPELAVVEEDLISYDETQNFAAIERLRNEIAQCEASVRGSQDGMGLVKRQLREIEDDRTLSSLRFDREQVLHSLREATEKWAAVKLADQVLNHLRHRIEQERQPRTLQDASDYLQRFTCGKYTRIWTRLGEKALLVDDEKGQAFRVEQLSSGTREQVFLSVRLAMIRDFSRQGIELPMVLDDVTVNFDQTRTEAAARTLMEVADQGQQILLLTCHLHFAQIFQQRGHEPIWLPALRAEAAVG
ncbi:AAA family ATPase [Planctomicrobium piriforme]|uniref:AAA domain-containing protein n=1 Tax=Planctomicrobium piriforme TaxID=1576369 RepID=A0A1I3HQN3_9PLAN|nr:AAA family ATPase [Planctomicrobium piriforme]SFI37982.1 AAA domain-containing protein [Planctomicrobium piriforme]